MIRYSKDNFIPDTETICDTCGKILELVPITVRYGFGHPLDETIMHFCSDKCMIKNTKKETKKQDERFIFGKQKGKKK
jgi:hypothetical protein